MGGATPPRQPPGLQRYDSTCYGTAESPSHASSELQSAVTVT